MVGIRPLFSILNIVPFCLHGRSIGPFFSLLNIVFPGPTPSNAPRNGSCPSPNHYVPRHINNRYINSYFRYCRNRALKLFCPGYSPFSVLSIVLLLLGSYFMEQKYFPYCGLPETFHCPWQKDTVPLAYTTGTLFHYWNAGTFSLT